MRCESFLPGFPVGSGGGHDQGRAFRLTITGIMCAAFALTSVGNAAARSDFGQNPVLFVHGIEGSGSQFDFQKPRFTSTATPTRGSTSSTTTRRARWGQE